MLRRIFSQSMLRWNYCRTLELIGRLDSINLIDVCMVFSNHFFSLSIIIFHRFRSEFSSLTRIMNICQRSWCRRWMFALSWGPFTKSTSMMKSQSIQMHRTTIHARFQKPNMKSRNIHSIWKLSSSTNSLLIRDRIGYKSF